MTPITVIAAALRSIPAKARNAIYLTYAVACVTVGALAVAHVGTGAAADVLAYLGIPLGFGAAANVDTES